jgi:hypothetical protein
MVDQHTDWLCVPIEIRPHVGAALAASGADKRGSMSSEPSIRVDGSRMPAMIVEAVDQDAAYTALAHVAEGDLGGWAVSGMP